MLMGNTPEARCLNQVTESGLKFQIYQELGRAMLGAEMTRRLHISRPAVLMVEKVFVHFDHLKIKNTHQLMTQLNRDWAANADAADKQSDIPEQSANGNRLFGGRH
ncbi:hypothetical protein T4C_13490 [Trichinella pseudospiralis]|nr:hypothetical protein T4C_13490 [Trichinella pseudospiralis]